jgi:hypothetical protein
MTTEKLMTAFADTRLIATGEARDVLTAVKEAMAHGASGTILIFEDRTGIQVDFDLRGTIDEVLARLPSHPLFAEEATRTGSGRPKLDVVSREVSLLPRHWEWLESQPRGASATIRRLVDEARKNTRDEDAARSARDATSKFMWAMAGNLENFEEASRALFAGDHAGLDRLMANWSKDIRDHVTRLLARA